MEKKSNSVKKKLKPVTPNKLDDLKHTLPDLDDDTVCRKIAELLEEQGHPAASAVREIADAKPAIPEPAPCLPPRSLDSDRQTMACSGWWDIERVAVREKRNKPINMCVWWNARKGAKTPALLEQAGVALPLTASIPLANTMHSPEDLRRAFEAVRRIVIGAMLGLYVIRVGDPDDDPIEVGIWGDVPYGEVRRRIVESMRRTGHADDLD